MTKIIQKVDYQGRRLFIGLDVHKSKWNVSIYLDQDYVRTFQQPASTQALIQHLNINYPNGNYEVCYESGFCGFWIQRELTKNSIKCIVVNASDVPQTNKSQLTKTDSNDSRRLAHCLSNNLLRPIFVPELSLESDRLLVRYRLRLKKDLQRCKIRVKSLLHQFGYEIPKQHDTSYWSNAFIKWLQDLELSYPSAKLALKHMIDQVLELRKKMLEVVKEIKKICVEDRYRATYYLLSTVPGIGMITAITLLTEINSIERFADFYKFNSFIGFCPSEYSSGEKERKGSITPRCHKVLRELLIEAAWISIRQDPALTLAFNQMKKTKGAKRAIICIARKLLNRIYTVWKTKTEYVYGVAQ